ncbi:hypothetical protein Tco_0494923 [Tanacetum coccineum]
MIVDIEDDIMDPVMQCTTLPSHSGFSQKKLVSFVTEIHMLSIDISLRDYVQNISEELAEFINSPSWSRPAFYLDDDEEYTIAITNDLPTEEPDNSLSMRDEHLDTIPTTESDEVIKSSVENLVLIPRESEVTSDNESECDVPVDDESSPTFATFSNPLFDSDNDFSSSDDESFSEFGIR